MGWNPRWWPKYWWWTPSSGDDDVVESEYIQRSDADESTSGDGDGDVVDDENIELNNEEMGESSAVTKPKNNKAKKRVSLSAQKKANTLQQVGLVEEVSTGWLMSTSAVDVKSAKGIKKNQGHTANAPCVMFSCVVTNARTALLNSMVLLSERMWTEWLLLTY